MNLYTPVRQSRIEILISLKLTDFTDRYDFSFEDEVVKEDP